jgi:TetR/AcrR family transcriptional regulator, cholesterol catabolism regulator
MPNSPSCAAALRILEAIRKNVNAGSFRPVDPKVDTLAMFGMCNWAYQRHRTDGLLRPREIAFQYWDMFTRGVKN